MEAPSPSRIAHLASVIQINTAKYDAFLNSKGLPSPSFKIRTPFKLDVPEEIVQARDAVLEANSELQALLLGPLGHLKNQTLDVSSGHNVDRALNDGVPFESIQISLVFKLYTALKFPPASLSAKRPRMSRYRSHAAYQSQKCVESCAML